MKFEKRFKKDLAKIETPDIEKIIPGAASKHTESRAPRARKRLSAAAVAVILCCCMVLGAAAATTAPLIRKILNDKRVTENTQQLTIVPEGYVGIYTKEDLLAIGKRGGPDGIPTKYILMSDIIFADEDYATGGICEGGIEPIEIRQEKKTKDTTIVWSTAIEIFNGNGYVIRNLKLVPNNNSSNRYYVGLFGSVDTIINLGIEDCEIKVVKNNNDYSVSVGAIASAVNFVGACYVDGLELDVECHFKDIHSEWRNNYEILVGGLCGQASYVDSCFVNNAKINVSGTGIDKDNTLDVMMLNIGGVAGFANSCVTSWFSGDINNSFEGKLALESVGDISSNNINDTFPLLMDDETFAIVSQNIMDACGGKDAFEYKKFCAYYLKKDIDAVHGERALEELMTTLNQVNNMTGGKMDLENQRVWYIFDPTASPLEQNTVYSIFLKGYNGDKEAVKQLCEYSYLTYGETYCYALDLSKPLNSEDLEGFDFDTVWTFRDGKPIQQVFAH